MTRERSPCSVCGDEKGWNGNNGNAVKASIVGVKGFVIDAQRVSEDLARLMGLLQVLESMAKVLLSILSTQRNPTSKRC